MNKRDDFRALLPQTFFLDPGDLPSLAGYLGSVGRLARGETVLSAEKAGEGNMNCVVRVRTSGGSFILKPVAALAGEHIRRSPAPFDRALVEGRVFTGSSRRRQSWRGECPGCSGPMIEARTVALEDLGAASDFFPLYAREMELPEETLEELVAYLSALHPLAPTEPVSFESLTNYEMRALNHEHIFALPLRAENGLDLDAYTGTPGLTTAAAALKADAVVRKKGGGIGQAILRMSRDTACCTAIFFRAVFCEPARGCG